MLNVVIEDISKQFIEEAQFSPQLLEDMASMEKYMAESYGERIFIELLQNADDAESKKIKLFERNGNIYFANNGREFNQEDIISISRSGASSKKRGSSIGYRGVGFKSTCYLTDEIIINSNGTFFTFSKRLCAKNLGVKDVSKVPTVRIPFLIPKEELNEELVEVIQQLKIEGFTTVFIFKNAKINLIQEELKTINEGYFLFLNNLDSAEISIGEVTKNFIIDRKINNNESLITISGLEKQRWYVITGEFNKKVDLAFKVDSENRIIDCSDEEAIFHCYLPTLEKTGYKFKINSDFSTDPSRKHLTYDDETETAIKAASNVLFNIIKDLFGGEGTHFYSGILNIVNNRSGFSKFSLLLNKNLSDLLQSSKWLELKSGMLIEPTKYKKIPNWLETSEFNVIEKTSEYVSTNCPKIFEDQISSDIEKFLNKYSTVEYNLDDWIKILSDENFVILINDLLLGKIYGYLIKSLRTKSLINSIDYNLKNCYTKTTKTWKLHELKNYKSHSKDFYMGYIQIASLSDSEWADKKYKTKFSSIFKESNDNELNSLGLKESNNNESKFTLGNLLKADLIEYKSSGKGYGQVSISKWRGAEQQCVEFELSLGNNAKDVSKQNLGYDVESLTPNGDVRYIEVKSLSKGNPSFSMTNNEYSAAHLYENKYFICLVYQNNNSLTFTYINNPIDKLNLEKRVRQWEWICEEYSGEEFVINFN